MSLLERVKSLFKKEYKVEDERSALRRYSIDVMKNEVLMARIQAASEMMDGVEKGFYEGKQLTVDERVALLDRLIQTIAVPWGRPADRWYFMQMVKEWDLLMGVWEAFREMRKYADEEVNSYIDMFAFQDMIPLGKIVYAASFSGMDVSPQYVAMIQGVPILTPQVPQPVFDSGSPSQHLKRRVEGVAGSEG